MDDTSENRHLVEKPPSCYLPARFVVIFWVFWAFVLINLMKFQMSVTILAMTDNSSSSLQTLYLNNQSSLSNLNLDNQSEPLPTPDTKTSEHTPYFNPETFNWNAAEVSLILGAYYWGYIATSTFGGWFVLKLGGKNSLGLGIFSQCFLSAVLPLVAKFGIAAVFITRVLAGMVGGITRPCEYEIWKNWAPLNEVGLMRGLMLCGQPVGAILSAAVNAYICEELGWPVVFILYGILGILWSVIWMVFIYDSPLTHPRISKHEWEYIKNDPISKVKTKDKTDWLKLLSSSAFWAPTAVHFSFRWLSIGMTALLPSYLHNALGMTLFDTGVATSFEFTVALVMHPLAGYVSDLLIKRGVLTTTRTRKLVVSIGLFLPALITTLMCLTTNKHLTVVYFTLGQGLSAWAVSGFINNYMDISPTLSSMLFSVSSTLAWSAGFVAPAVLAALLDLDQSSLVTWRQFFAVSAAIYVLGGLVFVIFGRGENQKYGKEEQKTELIELEEKKGIVEDVIEQRET